MALRIDRVEMDMDVQPAAPAAAGRPAAAMPITDPAFRERLRAIVLEIIEEEWRRIRRQQG